jgi:hypothetical protein
MADRGRVVVVAAGFALWSGGRCVAAARWSDVRRLRAYRRGALPDDAMYLGVELLDGSKVELHERAPGFDAFLDRASATLSGLLPFRDWNHTLDDPATGVAGVVVFDRKSKRY